MNGWTELEMPVILRLVVFLVLVRYSSKSLWNHSPGPGTDSGPPGPGLDADPVAVQQQSSLVIMAEAAGQAHCVDENQVQLAASLGHVTVRGSTVDVRCESGYSKPLSSWIPCVSSDDDCATTLNILSDHSDQALINLDMTIGSIDPFCRRLPPWPMLLVRPEFKIYTSTSTTSFTVTSLENIPEHVRGLGDDGYFQPGRQVIFITHGFFGSTKCSPWLIAMKDAILRTPDDSTVILVDWRYGADVPEYGQAASNTETTSDAIAEVAKAILETKAFRGQPDDLYLYCIGHSLGAHTCGQAGRKSRTPDDLRRPLFDRITGLDPAGPGFEMCAPGKNIDRDSAQCVDVIHTDGSLDGHLFRALHFGALTPWGHVDFYPNGGRAQPGCGPLLNDCGCSHQKAPQYFLATIGNPEVCGGRAVIGDCASEDDLPGSCSRKSETQQRMGYYSSCYFRNGGAVIEGKFYVNVTSWLSPYCSEGY